MTKNMLICFLVISIIITNSTFFIFQKEIKKIRNLENNYMFLTERFIRFENGYNLTVKNFETNLTLYSSKINKLIYNNNLENEIGCIVRWGHIYMPDDLRGDKNKKIRCTNKQCIGLAEYKQSTLGITTHTVDDKYVYVSQNDYQCPICNTWVFEKIGTKEKDPD